MTTDRRRPLLDIEALPMDPKACREDIARRHTALRAHRPPAAPLGHRESARIFQCDPGLRTVINTALDTGLPLLLTGPPGTGKSQVAWFVALAFGLGDPLSLHVRSTTTYRDFLYDLDAVAYLHAAYAARVGGEAPPRSRFIRPGPYWQAIRAQTPKVVLIDEIDKAPRDFPNDLLHVLGEGWFAVPDIDPAQPEDTLEPHLDGVVRSEDGTWRVEARDDARPIVVITSNSERRLPEPFLRRCVFHHIEPLEAFVEQVVRAHRAYHAALTPEAEAEACKLYSRRFRTETRLRRQPTLAEFLVWLRLLATTGESTEALRTARIEDLPHLEVLIKDRDDLRALRPDRLA